MVGPSDGGSIINSQTLRARLTDARTPTSHTHTYADITDPPTTPGPQTQIGRAHV